MEGRSRRRAAEEVGSIGLVGVRSHPAGEVARIGMAEGQIVALVVGKGRCGPSLGGLLGC